MKPPPDPHYRHRFPIVRLIVVLRDPHGDRNGAANALQLLQRAVS